MGKIALLLVLFSSFCFAPPAPPMNAICKYICEALLDNNAEMEKLRTVEAREQAQAVVKRIIELLVTKEPIPDPEVGYSDLVVRGDEPGKTLHSSGIAGEVSDDRKVVLELPKDGAKTVWKKLSIEGRAALVEEISAVYRQGQYDFSLLKYQDRTVFQLEAMRARGEQFPETPIEALYYTFENEGVGQNVGFSPLKMLQASSQKCTVGVCRTTNVAMAGLLLELGWPPNEVRLIYGADPATPKVYHIWLEVMDPKTKGWTEYDVTPSTDEANRKQRKVAQNFERILFGKTLSLPRNRARYTHDQTIISDFEKPTVLPKNEMFNIIADFMKSLKATPEDKK